ncbi:MAG: hypothetical protein NZ740_04025 [Kiritimatiellae bacterium]|nr:hypothetical protein [Kiritimatiellia bacterium]MDW8458257.1 hypothetical protein [Verrucomicrobiota bacterium]
MPVKHIRNKHLRRKRKSEGEKRRRRKVHIKRVVALGVPPEQAAKMDSKALRTLLRHPKKTAKRFAPKSA